MDSIYHIAFIMDGNRRYAKSHGLSLREGIVKGLDTLQNMLEQLKVHNIPYSTVYAFSTENWNRPKIEVDVLMALLKSYLEKMLRELGDKKIHIQFIGNIEGLPKNLIALCKQVMEESCQYKDRYLAIALNYGGKDEIVRAANKVVHEGIPITEDNISRYLDTCDFPDPDILIRTSGEHRLSNFLLWQLSYTELFFLDKLWPEMDAETLDNIIVQFYKRERRYGR